MFPLHSLDVPGLYLSRAARFRPSFEEYKGWWYGAGNGKAGVNPTPALNAADYNLLLGLDLYDLLGLGDLDVDYGLFLVYLF